MYIMYFPTILGAPKKHHFLSKVIGFFLEGADDKERRKEAGKELKQREEDSGETVTNGGRLMIDCHTSSTNCRNVYH